MIDSYKIIRDRIIMRTKGRLCENSEEIIESGLFREIIKRAVEQLVKKRSILLHIFRDSSPTETEIDLLISTFGQLTKNNASEVQTLAPNSSWFFRDLSRLNDFVEYLYNYWRGFNRFLLCDSRGDRLDQRPYRTFNDTSGKLSHLVRKLYRDIQENITGTHPRIYRQIEAGPEFAAICLPEKIPYPSDGYSRLNSVPVIRQVLMNPPLILEPTMNKRAGSFIRVEKNFLEDIDLSKGEWVCYPARVGELIIHVYFHEKFFDLGFTLCNLFDLADDEDLKRQPDALYVFGVEDDSLDNIAEYPTVFYDDEENSILVGACPGRDEFGYFGYLKKMVLTLHNIILMKRGKMPFHGALVKIFLRSGKESTILLMGDSGAGKSETLEALRNLGSDVISDILIIADDMGSMVIREKGDIAGYGTEIGAFLRIDDLKPGYAFGQIDRSIIMSASKTNARIVLPVTSFEHVTRGYKVDYILYANNYEEVDSDHPIIEWFDSPEKARSVFREGTVMSKGTTASTGIVHSYFANIFGPPQYRELHEKISEQYFNAFFKAGLFVGQMRTRLGIAGYEMEGPEIAARELLSVIES